MKNNLIKTVILLLAVTFVTLQSCEKKNFFETETVNVKETISSENSVPNLNVCSLFIYNGKAINEDNIDFNNENLTIIYGYGNNKYIFYSEADMYKWASSIKGLEKFAQSIKNIEIARNYAVKTGEIYKEEPSKEFEKYMNDNFNTGEKSGGIMYQNFYFGGWSNYMFPVPKSRLKSKYDNGLSSFKSFVNSYRLFDRKWWGGFSRVFITVGYVQWETMPSDINDKTSSYWAF